MASFSLNTGNPRPLSGFQTRTSDVFATLAGMEQDYDAGVKNRGPDEFAEEDRHSPERDGDFKRPAPPHSNSSRSQREHAGRQSRDAPRRHDRGGPRFQSQRDSRHGRQQWTPDHKLHPERWTAYSLEDTDVSGESANKRAAVDFFRDIRERKAKEARAEKWDAELYCGKLEFKMPVDKSKDGSVEELKGKVSYSNVHRLPEYVIGQGKGKSSTRKRSFAQSSCSSGASTSRADISLGHLNAAEESNQSQQSSNSSSQSETVSTPAFSKTSQSDSLEDDGHSQESGVVDQEQNVVEGGGQKIVFIKKGKAKRKIRERKDDD